MAYSSNDPAATDDASWLTKLEESCSSLNSTECQSDDDTPSSKHQTSAEDRFTERWLEAIDEDDPFGVGIQSDIPLQIQILVEAGFQKHLEWIQSRLLSACSARLASITCPGVAQSSKSIYYVTLRCHSACPILPRDVDDSSALRSGLFRFAMTQLNLYPSTPHTLLYPRIPAEWSADTLYSVARLLGPVRQSQVDFNLSSVKPVPLPAVDSLLETI
ncbi:hypothetical protein DAPPUDRAFT_243162 [Daphnia pulex]|uniref:Timeless C-terminal domain-containing protein n=1 Tax=Daphnia pulex TaxID=6669 RepID=E9GI58_DAPPU|nr:hypothetical protein DAPPUDRAFT_243162 [Daphnia pulex]|eukprot:EFX80618.1 hypothetical protein DAPPUDRAFT_243162 [Daphnia pulex]